MKKISLIILNIILAIIIVIFIYFLFSQKEQLLATYDTSLLNKKNFQNQVTNFNEKNIDEPEVIFEDIKEIKREKPAEKEIKALYMTAWSATSETKINELINFIKSTELNGVVIDIKDYSGNIAYDSNIELVNELETDRNLIKDLPSLLQKFKAANIYTIARQTVFQDPELTKKKPEWAVKNKNTGGTWYDYKGLSWADPTIKEVWDYNLQIAQEAISLGFDEINFDYIRFPSDGPMAAMQFADLKEQTKAEVMKNFFEFLHENLKDEPAYISGDLFGFTTEREDDMNIGQQIEDAALYFDYVCPMVYPSHYPSGYLNLSNPAANPYEVISHSIKKGQESLAVVENVKAKIRPWLQAFNMGAIYDARKIDLQIQASAENGGYGYLLWNARNVYNYAPKEK